MFLDYGHFGGGKSRTYLDSMLKDLDDMHNKMNAGDMTYRDIEIEGMKEILKDKEEEINRLNYIIRHNESREEGWKTYVKKFNDCMKDYKDLVKEYGKLEEENIRLRKINNELVDKFNQTLHE